MTNGFKSSSEPNIDFESEDIEFQLPNASRVKEWISNTIQAHDGILHSLTFIFCSDSFLHRLNVEYLDHDTLTDVITFPYQDPPAIQGDIFISIDRIKDNSQQLGHTFEEELHRVIIHGVLHLCGYGDKSPEEAKKMRELEDLALGQR